MHFYSSNNRKTKKTYRDAMEDPPGPNYAQNLLNQRV